MERSDRQREHTRDESTRSVRTGLTLCPSLWLLAQIPLWHHQKCLFKRETITNEALLVGLGNIRPDDVKLLRSKCGGVAAAVSAAAAAGGAGAPNVVILPPSLAGERFQVDYAKSGRSGCKHCGDKIGQDELRVGKMVQSQGPSHSAQHSSQRTVLCVPRSLALCSARSFSLRRHGP